MVCSCPKDRWKTPALSEVQSCNATFELSTAAFGTERKRALRTTTYRPARPFPLTDTKSLSIRTFPLPAPHHQIITLPNHPPNILLRNRPIQNNRIPVLLILMIPRNHRLICAAPEIPPFRINLHIQINIPVSFISPKESLPAPLHSHKLPVIVMKRRILICIGK